MAAERAHGRIFQINTSQGGVPKLARREDAVGPMGLSSDRQRHTKVHGGPERAVCLYSLERIQALQAEGHPVFPGSLGENLTLSGLDWERMVPGTRLALGEQVELELSSYTVPCNTIAASFSGGDSRRIGQPVHPGWSRLYARVIREGQLCVGDSVRIL